MLKFINFSIAIMLIVNTPNIVAMRSSTLRNCLTQKQRDCIDENGGYKEQQAGQAAVRFLLLANPQAPTAARETLLRSLGALFNDDKKIASENEIYTVIRQVASSAGIMIQVPKLELAAVDTTARMSKRKPDTKLDDYTSPAKIAKKTLAKIEEFSLKQFMSEETSQEAERDGGYKIDQVNMGLTIFISKAAKSIKAKLIEKYFKGDHRDEIAKAVDLDKELNILAERLDFKYDPMAITKTEHCGICHEDISEEEFATRGFCEHIFHKVCIDRHMQDKPNMCPTCRGDFILSQSSIYNFIERGEIAKVEKLISNGMDLEGYRTIMHKTTLLHHAVVHNQKDIIDLLISKGANINAINSKQLSPLMLACISGHTNIIQSLIGHGANVNLADGQNQTALILMCKSPQINIELLELLIAEGANIEATDIVGNSALHYAINGSDDEKKIIMIIKIFLERGFDINLANEAGETLLMLSSVNIARFLIKSGAKMDLVDNIEQTALHHAILNEKPEMVKFLIKSKANIEAKNAQGQSILHFAIISLQYEIAKLLIEHGADVKAVDNDGMTTLMLAIQNSAPSVVIDMLIDKGVDIKAINNYGLTALYYSVQCKKNRNTTELLRELMREEI